MSKCAAPPPLLFQILSDQCFFFLCRRYVEGEAVQTPYGDGIITEIVQDSLHIVTFIVQLFEDGSYRKCFVHQLYPIAKITGIHDDNLTDEMVFHQPPEVQPMDFEVPNEVFDGEMVFEVQPEDVDRLPDILPPTVQPRKKRFATLESRGDLESLADERNARGTKSNTRWAVKIFKG